MVSKSYLGGTTKYLFPDLTAIAGFSGTLPLSGDQVTAYATVMVANKPLQELLGAINMYGTSQFYYGLPGLVFRSASKKVTEILHLYSPLKRGVGTLLIKG